MEQAIERAETHGWVIFFGPADGGHVHMERRGRDGVLYLITVDRDGTVGAYGNI